jgi:hydroxycarboxylate dehydrogenase B
MKTIDHVALRALTLRILIAGGSDEAEAEIVVDHLIEANLAGHDSHGVGMLPIYCRNLEAGTLRANQAAEIVQSSGSFAVWDGRGGYGQRIAREAMAWSIDTARTHGVAVHGLRNTHHMGRIGTYGEIAAAAGLVSLHFVNVNSGPAPVAPFAGREGRFITNPICIAIPGTATTAPVILDFATSRIAMGKVRVAHNAGKPVIEGALLDASGTPTTNASVMYSDPRGVVLPFGEHKGSGLALICELLGGSLTGNGATEPDRKFANGMFSLYLDPAQIDPSHVFDADMARYLAWFREAKAAPGQAILTPGEPERATRAKRLATGVPLPEEAWEAILASARSVGVNGEPRR